MKKLIALLLALVMCLSLCACGKENDTSSTAEESVKTTDTNTENETTPTPDYASAFADILCSGKWVREDGREEITFNTNGTFSWISDEGTEEWTWSYYAYYDSSVDIPVPPAAAFSKNSCVYWGEAHDGDGDDPGDLHGHDGMMVGYNEEGTLVMGLDGISWTREE